MDLQLAKRAIDSYTPTLSDVDAKRLAFYYGMWEIQERHVAAGVYKPLDKNELEQELRSGTPFFSIQTPDIDPAAFLACLDEIKTYVAGSGMLAPKDSDLLENMNLEPHVTQDLLKLASYDFEGAADEIYGALVDQVGEDNVPSVPAFVLVFSASLTPLIEDAASIAMSMLDKRSQDVIKSRTCPVCGSEAALGYVRETREEDGMHRVLWCGLCRSTWSYERVRCARCSEEDNRKLTYKNVKGDDAHRIHVCETCKGYTRTVNQAGTKHPVSLEVEDVVMVYLDELAAREGYSLLPQTE